MNGIKKTGVVERLHPREGEAIVQGLDVHVPVADAGLAEWYVDGQKPPNPAQEVVVCMDRWPMNCETSGPTPRFHTTA